MNDQAICILCEKNAEKAHIPGRDGYFIKCDICGEYESGFELTEQGWKLGTEPAQRKKSNDFILYKGLF